jgi:hypothetical protein
MRFFRCLAGDAVYEQVRHQLDAAWGLPNSQGTATCIEAAATAPRDDAGRVVLAVNDEYCAWEPAPTLLPQLIASGAVAEITEADYMAALPQTPEPLPEPSDFNVVPGWPVRVR